MVDPRHSERGQVLPLFAGGFAALLLMAALLFDAGYALVVRRELQTAADSAAVAGANTLLASSVLDCSGSGGTTPRTAVREAALASLSANQGSLDLDRVEVVCAPGYGNKAVRVDLVADSPNYFWKGLDISASATALNGQTNALRHSVLLLNPYTSSWNKNNGCPSMLMSGGPTLIFEGSLQVNSACPAAKGGALATNGNASSLTFHHGSKAMLSGGYSTGPLTIDPAPLTGQEVIHDPLGSLPTPPSSLPLRSTKRLVLNNESRVLEPGVYQGGVQLKNSSQAFLKPGIFVLDGGGLDVGAQASVFSVDIAKGSTSVATWESDCTTTCGVLLYNSGTSSSMGSISIGAGATVALKPYQRGISAPDIPAYLNLAIWQSASPVPASNYSQPRLEINGGGYLQLSGTVYAPSAQVFLTGGAGGSGGEQLDVTLQFVVWDAQFQGNSSFRFNYQSEKFAKPYGYGLVE